MAAIELSARPEPLLISSDTTAIIVNDMQNAFCSPGGYLDKVGFDLSQAPAAIAAVCRVLAAARTAKLLVIHSQNGIARDLHDIPAGSPWWHKSPALRHMRAHPELSGQILTEGTWDYAIIDEAAPAPGELVIRKSRASCFAGTTLETHLRAGGIRTLVVIGIAINVGVEWTLREAMSREFYGVLVEDATMAAGPAEVHCATVYNVERFIGWVTTTAQFEIAARALAGAAS
ncbi:MAG: isochorismatase family protein [Xanthobacteraceae bacterium]